MTPEIVGIRELQEGKPVGNAALERWRQKLSGQSRVVAFADGEDQRAIRAATTLASEGILSPRLVGRSTKIRGVASQLGCEVPQGWILDIDELVRDGTISAMIGRGYARKPEQLEQMRQEPVHLAAAALGAGYVDACVAGAGSPTAVVLRAARATQRN